MTVANRCDTSLLDLQKYGEQPSGSGCAESDTLGPTKKYSNLGMCWTHLVAARRPLGRP